MHALRAWWRLVIVYTVVIARGEGEGEVVSVWSDRAMAALDCATRSDRWRNYFIPPLRNDSPDKFDVQEWTVDADQDNQD